MHQLVLKDLHSNRALFQKTFFGSTASSITQIILFSQRVVPFKMCVLKNTVWCAKEYMDFKVCHDQHIKTNKRVLESGGKNQIGSMGTLEGRWCGLSYQERTFVQSIRRQKWSIFTALVPYLKWAIVREFYPGCSTAFYPLLYFCPITQPSHHRPTAWEHFS